MRLKENDEFLKFTNLPFDNKKMLVNERNSERIGLYKATIKKCKSFCANVAVIICILLLIFSLLVIAFHPIRSTVHLVLIQSNKTSFVTDKKYLSIALDSSVIADGFKGFDMLNPKLIKMISHLSPGYWRIGGNMADRLIFMPDDTFQFKTTSTIEQDGGICAYETQLCHLSYPHPNFTMSGKEWLQLNNLAKTTNFTILFDLNCLIRYKNGSWNSQNAEELINYSNNHNLNVIWELGNEPNAFKHVFNYEVNATQLGKDFVILRNILNKYPRYKNSLLVGPDTTRPQPNHPESSKYLKEFLLESGHIVNAITWHQYYLNGRTATAADFIDPDVFDLLHQQIVDAKKIITPCGLENIPIWLGETSSAYGGGAPGYSNKYIGTFIWLDKLGMAAENGINLVVRQSIYKGYYALIDENYNPSPDWWVSVLYKTFVGPEIVPCHLLTTKKVRLYCQCTNKDASYDATTSIIVFGINMKESEAKIRIEGLVPISEEHVYVQNIFAYVLTTQFSLFSKNIYLNDEQLQLKSDGSLPPFKPKVIPARPYITMPPFSSAFFIIPSANVKACNNQ